MAKIEWRDAVAIGEIRDGKPTFVQIGPRALSVGKAEAGYFAVQNDCPHTGGDLSQGDVEDNVIICPLHGWEFDVGTGVCERHEEVIASYPVRVEGDMLQVEF